MSPSSKISSWLQQSFEYNPNSKTPSVVFMLFSFYVRFENLKASLWRVKALKTSRESSVLWYHSGRIGRYHHRGNSGYRSICQKYRRYTLSACGSSQHLRSPAKLARPVVLSLSPTSCAWGHTCLSAEVSSQMALVRKSDSCDKGNSVR